MFVCFSLFLPPKYKLHEGRDLNHLAHYQTRNKHTWNQWTPVPSPQRSTPLNGWFCPLSEVSFECDLLREGFAPSRRVTPPLRPLSIKAWAYSLHGPDHSVKFSHVFVFAFLSAFSKEGKFYVIPCWISKGTITLDKKQMLSKLLWKDWRNEGGRKGISRALEPVDWRR